MQKVKVNELNTESITKEKKKEERLISDCSKENEEEIMCNGGETDEGSLGLTTNVMIFFTIE